MRILMTYENLVPLSQADAEQFVNNAMALSRRGHHVDFLIPKKADRTKSAGEEVREYYQVEGPLHVDELPSSPWNLGAQHVRHAIEVPKDARFEKADLVYTRNLGMMTAARERHRVVHELLRVRLGEGDEVLVGHQDAHCERPRAEGTRRATHRGHRAASSQA